MSLAAMEWALRCTAIEDSTALRVLMTLASHANDDGRGAWPSTSDLASVARRDVRSIQRQLRALVKAGLIQAIDCTHPAYLRIPANRRPVVWALACPSLPAPGGFSAAHPRGDTSVTGDISDMAPVSPQAETRGDTDVTGDTGDVAPVSPQDASEVAPTSPLTPPEVAPVSPQPEAWGDTGDHAGVTPVTPWGDTGVVPPHTPLQGITNNKPPTKIDKRAGRADAATAAAPHQPQPAGQSGPDDSAEQIPVDSPWHIALMRRTLRTARDQTQTHGGYQPSMELQDPQDADDAALAEVVHRNAEEYLDDQQNALTGVAS